MSGAAARTGDLMKRENNNILKMDRQVVCKKTNQRWQKWRVSIDRYIG